MIYRRLAAISPFGLWYSRRPVISPPLFVLSLPEFGGVRVSIQSLFSYFSLRSSGLLREDHLDFQASCMLYILLSLPFSCGSPSSPTPFLSYHHLLCKRYTRSSSGARPYTKSLSIRTTPPERIGPKFTFFPITWYHVGCAILSLRSFRMLHWRSVLGPYFIRSISSGNLSHYLCVFSSNLFISPSEISLGIFSPIRRWNGNLCRTGFKHCALVLTHVGIGGPFCRLRYITASHPCSNWLS